MALLDRAEWYDIARDTNWTPKYVTEDELFPEAQSGAMGLPLEVWESYDEPYKVTYREYVRTQREKDAGVYSVKAALQRANFLDKAAPGWVSILKLHYGAFATLEAMASSAESRMARFGKAGGLRNMATFGSLDENRHGQIQLYFPHEHVHRSRQFDWATKSMHTNEWAVIAARHLFDDIMAGRDAVGVALMLTFAFETGFSNLQFLGLAADAAQAGDMSFSNLASSIQTDEARHAQIGGPAVKILIANGKQAEAQRLVDIAIWRAWTLFATVTGPSMDYYTPLDRREKSFKEFMQEWVFGQFERTLLDIGLERPWYWATMLGRPRYPPSRYARRNLDLSQIGLVGCAARHQPCRTRLVRGEISWLGRDLGGAFLGPDHCPLPERRSGRYGAANNGATVQYGPSADHRHARLDPG